MPQVHRMQMRDSATNAPLTEAWSLDPPDEFSLEMFSRTAEVYFPRVAERARFVVLTDIACRGCGCTEDRACDGGCSWARSPLGKKTDLCSACKAKGARS